MLDLRNIMSEMGLETSAIENKSIFSNTFRLVLFDQENEVNQDNNTNFTMVAKRKSKISDQQLTRLRRELKSSDLSEYDRVWVILTSKSFISYFSKLFFLVKCYSVEQLKEIHSLSDVISRIDFHTISPVNKLDLPI